MTSPANQQNIPAPNTTTATATGSYASAAGSFKKPQQPATVIATGSTPVAVGSAAATAQQHAKASSVSPMNGSKAPMPAAVPTVVRGTSNINGSSDHIRKSSVTISAPNNSIQSANGGPVGGAPKALPQFGFLSDSPHNTPQQTASVPVPIPGNARVPSPSHSPSPIPQPSASGGRPPSTIQQDGSSMKFGSFGADGDRTMKHMPTMSQNSMASQAHSRRDSAQSIHNEMGGQPGQPSNRGGFQPQGGRGRGYNNNPQYAGFPPGAPYSRGTPGQGRGGIGPAYPPRGPMPPYNNSPRQPHASPAMPTALPHQGTPQMQNAMPVPGPLPNYQHQPFHYAPPGGFPPQNQNYPPFNPQFDPMRGMMQPGYPTYNQVNQFMSPPSQSPSPGFAATYNGAQFNPPPPQQMSRNPSQVSERPSSSTGQIQPPVIVQGGSAPVNTSQAKPPAVVSSSFQKPKKSAIVIKNAAGETINFNALNKTPASPAATIQQSKTPPVIASTPTPPPKPSTPSHARTESASTLKTAEQVRKEFQQQVRKTTETPAEQKAREEESAKASAEEKSDGAAAKPDSQTTAEKQGEATSKVAEVAKEEIKATPDVQAAEKQNSPSEAAVEDEEDELERQIREMEEAEAKREAEEAEYAAKKKEKDAVAKKEAEEKRAAEAADNDRKLKEAEREMERLEEERERQRKENEGKAAPSVADLLSKKMEDLTVSDKKESVPSTPDAVTSKLSELKIGSADVSAAPSPSDPGSGKPNSEKQRTKPSALNLAPINTKAVEPPQPSAALQSLRTARFIRKEDKIEYPSGISSPNPALNTAVSKKGNFKYDPGFLLQFKNVFTEKPSMEFDQQLKTLMGDGESGSRSAVRTPAGAGSGRQGSRTTGSGFPAMGSMGSFGAKPLPPGTTSEQRFAMSSGGLARPNMAAIPSFSRPGGFPGPSQMSRTPSSSNMGNVPNSPRQGSRRTQSKRTDFGNAKQEAANNKAMPLTSGMDLKPIAVTSSGWKATSLAKQGNTAVAASGGLLDPAMVQRKVKAALNKMTPEKFDKIADQILTIALQSKDEEDGRTLRQVIQLTFEKATDEAHWASMYAKFCKRMLEMMSPEIRDTTILDKAGNVVNGGALFRKYLLNRCQEEFERGWTIDLPKPKEGENKEAVMLSDEYYQAAAAKRRGLGLVQFIGELYKLGMLTERIMHECVRKLVDYQATPDEAEIESLSKLLRTIGHNLDNTEKGKPMMDAYFNRIQTIIDLPDLPSRLQFMLMDVMDLRKRNWVSNEANKGPKTLDEVRLEAEAAAAQRAAEAARSSQRGAPGGRPTMGRGDARQFSYNQPAPNQVGMDDLRRLKGSTARSAVSNVTLGPTSMFASRSNSGRARLGPGGALGRAGEESGASSRTGTPPTRDASHTNAFSVLQNMETDNPASPPSVAASPALSKAIPDTSGAGGDKKESD